MIDADHQSLISPTLGCLVVNANIDAERQRALRTMLTAAQSRAARALLNWHQSQLAEAAGVSIGTVRNFETGRGTPIASTLAGMKRALEEAGVEFLESGGVQPRLQS